MKTTYSITRAQHDFPRLVRESAVAEAIAITRHDETVLFHTQEGDTFRLRRRQHKGEVAR